jgi:hypothetical protein
MFLIAFVKNSSRVYSYFFLCDAQNFDFPAAEFLHLFPSTVFAAHLGFFTFFAFAMFPPYVNLERFYHIEKQIKSFLSYLFFYPSEESK